MVCVPIAANGHHRPYSGTGGHQLDKLSEGHVQNTLPRGRWKPARGNAGEGCVVYPKINVVGYGHAGGFPNDDTPCKLRNVMLTVPVSKASHVTLF